VFTDFDGTLAEIVPDPATSVPVAGAVDVLHSLAEHLGVVAVVSGRPVAFLLDRLGRTGPGPRVSLFGLYGLERASSRTGPGRGDLRAEPGLGVWRAPVAAAAGEAVALAGPGVRVEDKGLSVTLHWRDAPDRAGETAAVAGELAARHGLVVHRGRMSAELVPPVAVDKGSVVTDLARDLEAACFLGDDLGDLAAFGALDELRASGLGALKIAVASEEAPDELLAAADLVLDGPAAALQLLRALDERVRAGER